MELGRNAEDFLEAHGRESQNTARAYRNALNRFAEFYKVGFMLPSGITCQGTLEDFIARVNADNKLDYTESKRAQTNSQYSRFLNASFPTAVRL
jgi:site-specific recombinase XerD